LVVKPAVTARLEEKVLVFPDDQPKEVRVFVRNNDADMENGTVSLNVPEDWQASTASEITFKGANVEKVVTFTVTPSKKSSSGDMSVVFKASLLQQQTSIVYDHIPTQTVFEPATARCIRVEVETTGQKIGYIKGAGDEVPQSLQILGYEVELLDPASLGALNLIQYDAIVTGVRAYNTQSDLAVTNDYLLEYVKNGGTMVVQYNTSHSLVTSNIGPYPFKPSRDRVTREDAEVTILDKKHNLLNYPNKITEEDFDHWVQERGLYFPNEWSKDYTALLSWHDPGEEALSGALLSAEYGKGQFIYTGISFFRQLPAGVPGAYRLFANLVSAGKAAE